MAQRLKRLPGMQETRVQSLGQENPLEKEMATHSSTLGLENPMEGGAWWATVHGVAKSRARRSYFTHFHFRCVYRRERPSEREREVRRERMDGE